MASLSSTRDSSPKQPTIPTRATTRHSIKTNSSIIANLGDPACAESFQSCCSGSQIGLSRIGFGSQLVKSLFFLAGSNNRSAGATNLFMADMAFSSVMVCFLLVLRQIKVAFTNYRGFPVQKFQSFRFPVGPERKRLRGMPLHFGQIQDSQASK